MEREECGFVPLRNHSEANCLFLERRNAINVLLIEAGILLTGDGLLRGVAADHSRRVHGVLWVIDELNRLALCGGDIMAAALEFWRDDSTVRLPMSELPQRLRLFRRA